MKKKSETTAPALSKLSRNEMKNINGGNMPVQGNSCGIGTCYSCTASNGNQFAANSASFMNQWAGFWQASGYTVTCNSYVISSI